MIRNKILSRFIVVTLTAALLLFMGSRAIPVSALADPVPQAIAPVFDTQIYQLQDYIDHGGMSDPQLEIFYVLAGLYAVAQAGSQSIHLNDVYANESGVWNWLKSMGIRTYNSVINLIPDTARMPITGELYSTIPFKNASALFVASLMGMAIEAKSFDTVQEFKEAVATGSYYLPWNLEIQKGMNSIFGIYGGIYSWQFDSSPFESDFEWRTIDLNHSSLESWQSYVDQLPDVTYRANSPYNWEYNVVISLPTNYDLFFNTSDGLVYLVYGAGISASGFLYDRHAVSWSTSHNSPLNRGYINVEFQTRNINDISGSTLLQKTQYIYNHFDSILVARYGDSSYYFDPTNVIGHVYAGDSWLSRQEIYNLTDLNFADPDVSNDNDYYVTVPDDPNTKYFLDIHNLVHDLVDNSDLFQIIINHIVDEDGVQVHDDQLIRVTTSIYQLLQETNPVLPVNLNDVAEYTDNTYMDLVKEHATSAGNALAALVAFWHNCDAELIYVMFGAGLTVLVGAFIGKWGHS